MAKQESIVIEVPDVSRIHVYSFQLGALYGRHTEALQDRSRRIRWGLLNSIFWLIWAIALTVVYVWQAWAEPELSIWRWGIAGFFVVLAAAWTVLLVSHVRNRRRTREEIAEWEESTAPFADFVNPPLEGSVDARP